MAERIYQDVIKEKLILDANTGKPVKEIVLENGNLRIVKENGEAVEIPANTIRAKYILMRVEAGLSEITEPIYV